MSKKQELTPEQILQQSIYYNAFNDAINAVLEIIDERDLWERLEDGTMFSVDDEIRQAVLALRG